MNIGPYNFDSPLILAPMAGVTDQPFRNLCYELGADLCVSEMVTSEKRLWNSRKTRLRLKHEDQNGIRSVQIAGTEPIKLAEAAKFNVAHGAQVIDINMGCPAKKVCNVQAGSALLKNELLVADILTSVVAAVEVPVTLKIRTGWDKQNKNAVNIARIAEQSGIACLAVHGRTRADGYSGTAEYDTIAEVKDCVNIPVIANGDITSVKKAREVLHHTQADGLMIGRAAQGNPWIFQQIKNTLTNGSSTSAPDNNEISRVLSSHLKNLYDFYGDIAGVRIARKHIGWYIKTWYNSNPQEAEQFRKDINQIDDADIQLEQVTRFFNSRQPPLTTRAA
jgi:tRNA-dihydrouridine synthase B